MTFALTRQGDNNGDCQIHEPLWTHTERGVLLQVPIEAQ